MAKPHLILPPLTPQQAERFHSRVDRRGPDECWPWTRGRFPYGYGCFSYCYKNRNAARVAYFLHYGVDPGPLLVRHQCDNPPCCNPAHLKLGTVRDNSRDAIERGRTARGERHGSKTKPECVPRGLKNGAYTHPEKRPRGERHGSRTKPERMPKGERQGNAKLTEEAVREIRASTKRQVDLAAQFGVDQTLISLVKCGRIWTHVH